MPERTASRPRPRYQLPPAPPPQRSFPPGGGYGLWQQRQQAGAIPPSPYGASGAAPQAPPPMPPPYQQKSPLPWPDAQSEMWRNILKNAMQNRADIVPRFTPEAQQTMLGTPTYVERYGQNRVPYSGMTYYGSHVGLSEQMAPGSAPGVYGHEIQHVLGGANNTDYEAFRRAVENGIGWQSFQSPAAMNFADAAHFPGMFNNPPSNGWGGPAEFYASLGRDPSRIPPPLQPFYPQYNQQAFTPPSNWTWKWIAFEDGTSGWSLVPNLP